jgi:hypothetical protein
MMKVVWYIQGDEEFQSESVVDSATEFLETLHLVDVISLDGQEYMVRDTEMVVGPEPYLAILLEG